MTTPKLCSDCIHYHVPASKEPCRDCLPQTVAVPNFKRNPWNGGECPVSPDTQILARIVGRVETIHCAVSAFEWPRDDIIIEYKLL